MKRLLLLLLFVLLELCIVSGMVRFVLLHAVGYGGEVPPWWGALHPHLGPAEFQLAHLPILSSLACEASNLEADEGFRDFSSLLI